MRGVEFIVQQKLNDFVKVYTNVVLPCVSKIKLHRLFEAQIQREIEIRFDLIWSEHNTIQNCSGSFGNLICNKCHVLFNKTLYTYQTI